VREGSCSLVSHFEPELENFVFLLLIYYSENQRNKKIKQENGDCKWQRRVPSWSRVFAF